MYTLYTPAYPLKPSFVGYKCLAMTLACFSTPHTPSLAITTATSTTFLVPMAMNSISQEHPQAWRWEVAMYTNLHYHHRSYEREHLFEKPLTPSDVGKLNRLVIPKQHAERYFPLGGGGGGDGEKGLLLAFEDEAGKPWRFRYSYWTSSQSYVLTKGWSRYVKEKRLDAGDVVHFERVRGVGAGDRLFIGCRRRGEEAQPAAAAVPPPPAAAQNAGEQQPWSPMCYSTSSAQEEHTAMLHAGDHHRRLRSAPPRRLRLFGVNLDCGPELPEPEAAATEVYSFMHQTPYAANYWGSS